MYKTHLFQKNHPCQDDFFVFQKNSNYLIKIIPCSPFRPSPEAPPVIPVAQRVQLPTVEFVTSHSSTSDSIILVPAEQDAIIRSLKEIEDTSSEQFSARFVTLPESAVRQLELTPDAVLLPPRVHPPHSVSISQYTSIPAIPVGLIV